ncbi:hypothetical protein HDU85_004524 [Gaertneriomyces sp. JEL0708]|nr:hypothetical protein HDU85_004524 [Gaertneriomyces sp. JEL0708]
MLSHIGNSQVGIKDGTSFQASQSLPNERPIRSKPADPSAKPRLVISKMVLKNFKSYAGVVEIGPFHKSFTSIVGPNGSGKSNVIDSLLFVFGFKAKKMRQGKLSELIHNSMHHQNLSSCSVEVHFREIIDLPGPDAFDVVPGSDLVVSRTVERGAGEKTPDKSTYRINGRTSTFTEVTSLLKGKGVDLDHKRFLILQGEVESIALMKPKAQNEHEDGLLEYLEDIIGTSRYKEPISEASAKLEALNEARTEKLNRLKFVERDKNSLEDGRRAAEEFVTVENQLVAKKNELYHVYIAEYSKDIERLTAECQTLSARREGERQRLTGLTDEVRALESTHRSLQKDYNSLSHKTSAVRQELQKYERAEVELKEKDSHLKKKVKKLTATLQKETSERSDHSNWIKNFDSDLAKARSEAEQLAAQLSMEEQALEKIRDSLRGKTEVFQKQIEKKQEELAPWMERVNECNAYLDVVMSEKKLLEERMDSSKNILKDAEQNVLEIRAMYSQKRKHYAELKAQWDELQQQLTDLQQSKPIHTKSEAQARQALGEIRQKADEARVAMQKAQNRGNVYTALMQQSAAGRIQGICGRLGDLGLIDERYDVAVTTACGNLDNIVVETVEAGQKCIEYLRTNGVGRATFICLDRLKKYDMSPIETPQDAPRLFDLIKPKHPRYAPAFYNGVGNTLVAQDLEHANRIAFGARRWRVVTLDGQLIDQSGAMSGGGTQVKRGGMGSKFVADEVTKETVVKLEQDKRHAEIKLQELVKHQEDIDAKIAEHMQLLEPLEVDLQKLKMEINFLTAELSDAEKHVTVVRAQHREPSTEDLDRVAELAEVMKKANREIEKLKQGMSGMEAEIEALQNKILEVGGVRLRSQQAKVDGINEQIEFTNTKITKLQVERTTRDKSLTKLMKSISKCEQELEGINAEAASIQGDLLRQRQAAEEFKAKLAEVVEVLENKGEESENIKRELEEKTALVNEVRKTEVEIAAQLAKYVEDGQAKSKQKRYYEKEIATNLQFQRTGLDEEEEDLVLETFTVEQVAAMDKQAIEGDIKKLQDKIAEGTPNLSVLAEYRQKMNAYLERAKDLDEITQLRDQAKQAYDELRNQRLAEFMEGFTAISQKLKEMYQMITMGGNAELELVDSLDPFSEGIIFSVMPPKKSWKNISNLSGGEKTLSSLALVFALHHFKPTPLYVMDEIDAALDFRNVSIVASYIKERTKNAQFVIISLRNNMFELADRLVGIYKVRRIKYVSVSASNVNVLFFSHKTENTTKSITINPTAVA